MSGSGPSYTVPPTKSCPCESLTFSAVLQSPDLTVIRKLSINDELKIASQGPRGPVVAIDDRGGIAGSIVNTRTVNLLQCIDDNFVYIAEVVDIHGNQVSITVRPE